MKTKTVLVEGKIKEELYPAQRSLGSPVSIHNLPTRNLDVRAETEFRCSSREARLLGAEENYTGCLQKVKGSGGNVGKEQSEKW
jgi:hypothetical protein